MKRANLSAPFLKRIAVLPEKADESSFPFNTLPFLRRGEFSLDLTAPVTILVGENGSGKSTLVEAIAAAAGFSLWCSYWTMISSTKPVASRESVKSVRFRREFLRSSIDGLPTSDISMSWK